MNPALLTFSEAATLFYHAMETQDRFSALTILYLVQLVFIDFWQQPIIFSGDEFIK